MKVAKVPLQSAFDYWIAKVLYSLSTSLFWTDLSNIQDNIQVQ